MAPVHTDRRHLALLATSGGSTTCALSGGCRSWRASRRGAWRRGSPRPRGRGSRRSAGCRSSGASGSATTGRGSPRAREDAPDQLVEAEPFGPGDLDHAVQRPSSASAAGQGGGEVGGRRSAGSRTGGRRTVSPSVAPSAIRADELEELRRADDRVRDAPSPRSASPGRPWLAGSRCRAGGRRRRSTAATWCPTPAAASASRRLRVEVSKNSSTAASSNDGRVRHVDDHRGAGEGVGQAFAGEGVDTGVGRRGDRLVAVVAEDGDERRSDEPGTSDDDEFHDGPFAWVGVWRDAVIDRRTRDGSRRRAFGSTVSPVVQHTLCWPCSSVASARRASGLWSRSCDRQAANSPSRSKASREPGVAEDVVHGPEPVVRPGGLAAHQRVATRALPGHGDDLEQPVVPHGADELARVGVRPGARGERDPDPARPVRARDVLEHPVGLGDETAVGGLHDRVTAVRGVEVGGGDLVGRGGVDAGCHGTGRFWWGQRGGAARRASSASTGSWYRPTTTSPS